MSIPDLPDSPSIQDAFDSREETRINHAASRVVKWLFQPPYLPGSFIWLLLAIIISNIGLEFLAQPDGFWADPSISTDTNFLYAPFSWGIWILLLDLAYLLLMGVLLTVLYEIPAFAVGMVILVSHLSLIIFSFDCNANYFLNFMNSENCSAIYTGSSFLVGIFFAIGLIGVSHTGMFPWLKVQTPSVRLHKGLTSFAMAWIVISIFAVLYDGIQSKINWKPIEVSNLPPARTAASFAYDTQRSIAVLFGGTTSWSPETNWNNINDTWEWNGEEWNQMEPTHVPQARLGAAAAYDEKRGVTVMFGGSGKDATQQQIFFDDTWEWDGKDWARKTTDIRPLPRQAPGMYYDPILEAVVVYGGYYFDSETQTQVFHDDVWSWDGVNWQEIPWNKPDVQPLVQFSLIHLNKQPYFLDGEDLWTLQETLWVPLNFSRRPSNRWGSQMAYNPSKQVVVLFGGYKDDQIFGDTWTYDGQDWRQIITSNQPMARHGSVMFYDQFRGSIVLFGGLNGGTFYQDMWEIDLK